MAKRGIDMLPLLDVFMVVLFVFATIQEGQLDDTTSQLEQAENARLAAELTAATESARAAVLSAELAVSAQEAARAEELETLLGDYERVCGPRVADAPVCPAADPNTRELVEVAAVHEQLLSHIAVFELEIAGEERANHIFDHCCVRADPPRGEWRRCGVIPSGESLRADWFDDGGEGLRDVLRETRDGYAIVLLKQDLGASYQVSKDLARLLHERMRGHYVYDNGVSDTPLSCSLLPRE
jgi:biopolymer transport protein ExbD